MERSADGKYRVVARRRMPAPREVVFDAWIDPEGIREWMCPGNATSAEATLDVRVGGSFRIVMKAPDRDHVHVGTYQIVDRPSKLVFTWSGPDATAEVTLVTVEFISHGNQSEMVLTHERLTNPDVAQRYESGWGTIVGKFSAYLSRGSRRTAGN